MVKKISLYLLIAFFVFAGYNHFRDPEFYYPLIPPAFEYIKLINIVSGALEIILGLGLLLPYSRKYAAFGLIIMLFLFIPSHVYFIMLGSCINGGLCVPAWIAWARLLIIHPLLLFWIWAHRR